MEIRKYQIHYSSLLQFHMGLSLLFVAYKLIWTGVSNGGH